MNLSVRLGLAVRSFPSLVTCALLAFAGAASAQENVGLIRNAPVLKAGQTLGNIDLDAVAAPVVKDLAAMLEYPAAGGSYARIATPFGDFYLEFFTADAPLTVANFKSYLATDGTSEADRAKTYDGTFIHRAVPGFVIQGGGYRPTSGLPEIPKKPPVANEFKAANTRGTIAMAKVGPASGPPTDETINSATNQWFISLDDNRDTLDNQNGGFTAFGRVLGDGMKIVDRIAGLNQLDLNPGSDAFDNLPYYNVRPGQSELELGNLFPLTSVREVAAAAVPAALKTAPAITYQIATNTHPAAITATIAKNKLTIRPGRNGGRSTVTLRASVGNGIFSDFTFLVTKAGPPTVVKQLPANTTAALGGTLTLTANVTAWPINIKWQHRTSPTGVWTDIPADDPRFSGVTGEKLTIRLTGANPAAVGNALALADDQFRFVVTNNFGGAARVAEGKPTTLRVTTTLAFAGKLPATTTAALGNTFTLSAPALPATYPAPTYRWERLAPDAAPDAWQPIVNSAAAIPASDGPPPVAAVPAVASPYSGVTTAHLTIRLNGQTPASSATTIDTAATLALRGSKYRCVISHDRGAGVVSTPGLPTTLLITTLPLGFSTQPAKLVTGTLGANTTISVIALPAANNTPRSYQWKRKAAGAPASAPWETLVNSTTDAPTRYTGVTTPTLTISLAGADDAARQAALALNDDQYQCVVSNFLGSAASTSASLRVLAARPTFVTHEDIELPGLAALEGRSFTATGLPKGLLLGSASGRLTGIATDKPGVYKVTVTIRDGAAVTGAKTYYLEVRALSGHNAGGFEALLSAVDQAPAAKLSLVVAGNGVLTGTLTTAIEKKPLALKGAVVRSPAGVLSLAADLAVARPGAPQGRTYLVTDLSIAADGKLSAKLKTRESAATTPVEIGATTTGVHLAAYSPTNPAPWALVRNNQYITYNFAFTKPTLLAEGGTPPPIPGGSGHARAPITAEGRLNLVGKLPDGAPITASLATGTDASYRLFARPYSAAAGAFVSSDFKLVATNVQNSSGGRFNRYALPNDGGEDTFWRRPAGVAKPAGYTAGFGPLGLTLRVQPWIFFNGTNLGLKFTTGAPTTIGVALSGATLSNATPNPRGLPTDLAVNFQTLRFTDAALPDPSALTLNFVEKTGAFSGTLKLTDGAVTRTVAIEGIFLVPTNVNNTVLANGTVTAEGLATIPGLDGAAPTTERIRLHQQGAVPAP